MHSTQNAVQYSAMTATFEKARFRRKQCDRCVVYVTHFRYCARVEVLFAPYLGPPLNSWVAGASLCLSCSLVSSFVLCSKNHTYSKPKHLLAKVLVRKLDSAHCEHKKGDKRTIHRRQTSLLALRNTHLISQHCYVWG